MCLQVSLLARIGGKTFRDVVNGIMRQLLTVSIQRRYNWCGQKGKIAFGKLKIASVLGSKLLSFTLITLTCFFAECSMHCKQRKFCTSDAS